MFRGRTFGTTIDGNDKNTLLMLHADDFTDSSQNNSTIYNHEVDLNQNGKFGKCFHFNGESYLSFPIRISSINNFTIDFWIKIDKRTSNQPLNPQYVLCVKGKGNESLLEIIYKQSNICLKDNKEKSFCCNKELTEDNWHHIAVVNSNRQYLFFINGQRIIETTLIKDGEIVSETGYLGSNVPNDHQKSLLSVYIDEFRISNKARWTSTFTPPTKRYE